MKITTKLIISYLTVALIVVVLGVVSYVGLNALNGEAQKSV